MEQKRFEESLAVAVPTTERTRSVLGDRHAETLDALKISASSPAGSGAREGRHRSTGFVSASEVLKRALT
ncbi:MAG: hypothetical protein AAGK22_14095 [Acidobacteriota bacterium]